MARHYTFGKKERLKSRKSIETLFQTGRRFSAGNFRVLYMFKPEAALAAGTGVSSRLFKKAVDRNRVKRLTRGAWRLQKQPLDEKLKSAGKGLHVFFIFTTNKLPDFLDVNNVMAGIVKRLLKELNENPAQDS